MQTYPGNFALVSIIDCPYSADRLYTYLVPSAIACDVVAGAFVLVPFGTGNKKRIGLVHSLADSCEYKRVKPIFEVIKSRPVLSDEAVKLCEFVSKRCFCTVGTALKAVIPPSVMPDAEFEYKAVLQSGDFPKIADEINSKAMTVLGYIAEKNGCTDIKLISEFGEDAPELVKSLEKLGLVERHICDKGTKGDKYEKYIFLSEDADVSASSDLTPKQQLLCEYLTDYGELSQSDILQRLPITASVINSLVKKGIAVSQKRLVTRNPFESLYTDKSAPRTTVLSEEQQRAYQELEAVYDRGEAAAALLFGVTGSGKTMVMKKLMDKVIADGKKVILLLPEIALTPQAVRIFISFYKKRVAVFHSALSIGERHDIWRSVQNNEVDLVIGTRSAVFAPIDDLGLIIIDEEQESTYKSDISPKYHAKDIASFRCGYHKAMLLLCSATPSVESYYKAKSGVYTLTKLTKRYGGAGMPDTMIADMRFNSTTGEMMSKQLTAELAARIERREKSVLFLNRRGYHVFMSCRSCGDTVMCPNCSVSLTLHRKTTKNGVSDKLICHYCGYTVTPPKTCPSCHSDALRYFGLGTQKVEDELAKVIPEAKCVRMDADTTVAKMSHKAIIDEFEKEETDILVGTQMVTKGHDFKDVTLVGILSADMSLHSDDYRASERTFDLITQCAGRAGRAGKKGLAVIQTYTPNHPVIINAANQDYETFYENEIAIRKKLMFPPFCDFAVFLLVSQNEHELLLSSKLLRDMIERECKGEFSDVPLVIFGPFEAGIYKLSNSYRLKIVIKCKLNKRTRMCFEKIMKEISKTASKDVSVGIDINPSTV